MEKVLLAIDGNSLMHRAFYALPAMNGPDGSPVNAVFGFLSMLLKVLEDEKPTHLAVAFDMHGPTFRHGEFVDYKAGRKDTPEDLRPQFPLLRKTLRAMGVAVLEAERFEADDILGTLVSKANAQGMRALVVTGDRDALQLVSPTANVLLTKKGISETQRYDENMLMEQYRLRPDQIPDLKGLMGDNSDNIPGIKGVGEKTALELLATYGTVENLLEHVDELKGKLREKVEQGKEDARKSKWLATIVRDVPLDRELDAFPVPVLNSPPVLDAMEKLAFRALIKRIQGMRGAKAAVSEPQHGIDMSLEILQDAEKIADMLPVWLDSPKIAMVLGFALELAVPGKAWRIPLQRDLLDSGLQVDEALTLLKPLLVSGVEKLVFHGKVWLGTLDEFGLTMENMDFDAMIAGYLLDPISGRYTLEDLVRDTLGREPSTSLAHDLLLLCGVQGAKLEEQNMAELFHTMEMPLIRVLYDMEKLGFRVDGKVLGEIGREMDGRIGALTGEIHDLAGDSFNISSTKQLGAVLFEKLQLPVMKKGKTGYSTDVEVLEKLQEMHPIIPLIMEYRQLTKLKSTYIDGLMPLVREGGRVHTRFNQTGTSTGRLSSSEPNLQNIPIRMPEGRMIRKAFVAADDQHVLVDADYSQIELRILAHVSGDQAMIRAFRSGDDFHRRTASEVFGIPLDEVTSDIRSSAKAINFGIVYGISDFGLARQLGIDRKRAGAYIQRYLGTYHGVRELMDRTLSEGRETGFVKTMFNRRRPMPELRSANQNIRSAAERAAINAPIQGAAADIMKLAMIGVHRAIQEQGLSARLILQVHDELIIDTPLEEVKRVETLVKNVMEQVAALSVPLIADVNAAYRWYDAK